MNVLVINGSPKGNRSNTLKLTKAFLKGAGYEQAEIVTLAKLTIQACRGCFSCWRQTPGSCVIQDEMAELLEKIITADTLIWSFPLYYYSVPGLLKNVIDRQLPLNLPQMSAESKSGGHLARYDLSSQRHVVLSTCGFWTAEGNYNGVKAIFDGQYGKGKYTAIFCGQGELFRIPALKKHTDTYLETVQQAGREFATGEVRDETQERLSIPLFPQEVFEQGANASW